MLPLKLLGSLDPRGVLAEWVLAKLWEHGASAAIEILKDAKGYVTRVGDLIVWQGGSGRRVLAGLTAVTESQARIGRHCLSFGNRTNSDGRYVGDRASRIPCNVRSDRVFFSVYDLAAESALTIDSPR